MDQNRNVQNVATKSAFTPNSNATYVDCKRAIRQFIKGEKILQALVCVQEALGSCLDVATMLTFIRLMPAVVTCISYTN